MINQNFLKIIPYGQDLTTKREMISNDLYDGTKKKKK